MVQWCRAPDIESKCSFCTRDRGHTNEVHEMVDETLMITFGKELLAATEYCCIACKGEQSRRRRRGDPAPRPGGA
jgi:hypothetical protein